MKRALVKHEENKINTQNWITNSNDQRNDQTQRKQNQHPKSEA
ncbi:20376_t:CDS:2 [Dentiscutata erythropus]|uniref:20376_t:CDS:1 n=1 Tax=Dentiscutata erythropus TaxID=1348616 RepID=A0A9N9BSL8_9GLOM|nr:20376_t:CDS:2 [Dentiscutata erythropus]